MRGVVLLLHSTSLKNSNLKQYLPGKLVIRESLHENLFIDIYGFYAQYTNFIGLTVLVKNPFG